MMPEGGYMQMAIVDRYTDRHKDQQLLQRCLPPVRAAGSNWSV